MPPQTLALLGCEAKQRGVAVLPCCGETVLPAALRGDGPPNVSGASQTSQTYIGTSNQHTDKNKCQPPTKVWDSARRQYMARAQVHGRTQTADADGEVQRRRRKAAEGAAAQARPDMDAMHGCTNKNLVWYKGNRKA